MKMKVEIWSDVMCPFCYIGKRHFENALEQFNGADDVEVIWKSFQLDPSIPDDPEQVQDVYTYLSERKGISRQQLEGMHQQVTQMAATAGLTYHLDKTIMANSFRAHRLIQLAKEKGLGDKAEEVLFHANFTEGKDFNNIDVLTTLGKQIGLTADEVNEALTDDKYAYAVKTDINEANAIGVSGVPFFVIDGRYGISGAQPVETFAQILEKAYTERNTA